MRGAQWTAGPWHIDFGNYCRILDPSNNEVASVAIMGDGIKAVLDQERSTAHLIAAAPEIYEALEEMDAFCETGYEDGDEIPYADSSAMQKTLAALAKARGETGGQS